MITSSEWTSYGASGNITERYRGFNSDFAYVTVKNISPSGKTLIDTVGGAGVAWNGSNASIPVDMFGYPGNLSGNEVMYACSRKTFGESRQGYPFHFILGCNMGGGSSGGGWLKDYNNTTGLGYIASVTSFGPESTGYLGGVRMHKHAEDVYNNL